MASFAEAMSVFTSSTSNDERQLVQLLLTDLLDRDGLVRFNSVVSFHNHICHNPYGFVLRRKTMTGVRTGGHHLFYVRGNLLLRVKTSGTELRPVPHMTISMATGPEWAQEVGKLSRTGELVPKQGAIPRVASNHRVLRRLHNDLDAIGAIDDRWANICHYDFVAGFDGSRAAGLPVARSK